MHPIDSDTNKELKISLIKRSYDLVAALKPTIGDSVGAINMQPIDIIKEVTQALAGDKHGEQDLYMNLASRYNDVLRLYKHTI
jgi:hypothetical protein